MSQLKQWAFWLARTVWQWYRTLRRSHPWRWRLLNAGLAALIVVSTILPLAEHIITNRQYAFTPEASKLIGQPAKGLADQLEWNASDSAWHFNTPSGGDTAAEAAPIKALQAKVGGGDSKSALYGITLPTDLSKGITYTDTNTQQSFTLVPAFKTFPGRLVDGHIVYPLGGGVQVVYTLKTNGLKEDIYVPHSMKNELRLDYTVQLPKTLEMKAIPDTDGMFGVYGADPVLYGNVSANSDKDQDALQKARENGEKTNLVFGLPELSTKAVNDNEAQQVKTRYAYKDEVLTVTVDGLEHLTAPAAIDPSVVVTSSSDFQTAGNNEGMIDFSTADQITRGGLTGGSVGAWTTSGNNISSTVEKVSTIAYNGYLYRIGGYKRTATAMSYRDVQYAVLNASTGSIGAWTSTTILPVNRFVSQESIVVWNGYMYVLGGTLVTSTTDEVDYIKINSDGSLGSSWTTTTSLPAIRVDGAVVAYGGYVYYTGGSPTSGGNCTANADCQNTVFYAPLNPDGTLGAWASTTSFTTGRSWHGVAAYNGYMYILGGTTSNAQYARINTDGTVGAWSAATTPPIGNYGLGVWIVNGYIYMAGGINGGKAVYYAQVNANGSIGTWRATTYMNGTRIFPGYTYANGYLYAMGGYDNVNTVDLASVEYTKIDPAGAVTPWRCTYNSADNGSTCTNGLPAERNQAVSVAYNGYLYVLGGQNNAATCQNAVYYAPLNANGTVGMWGTTTSFTNVRLGLGAVAYNGYMYIMGGGNCASTTLYDDIQFAPINSNGTLGAWRYTHNSTDDNTTYVAGFGAGTTMASYAVANNYVYVMGGTVSGGVGSKVVYYAPLNSNGTVGAWNTTTLLTHNRVNAMAVTSGRYMYVLGGTDGGATYYDDIQFAPINSNGTLGAWRYTHNSTDDNTTYVAGFTSARRYFTAFVSNGYLYIAGGDNGGGTRLNDVQFAALNADGTVGSWTPSVSIMTARQGLTMVAYRGYAYMIGGYDGTNRLKDVQFSVINNGGSGTVGAWSTTTDAFLARRNVMAVALNGYLYVIGGVNTSAGTGPSATYYSDVHYAPINADGSLGSWSTTTNLSTSLYNAGMTTWQGRIYIVGGDKTSALQNAAVYSAAPATDGTIASWRTETSLPVPRTAFGLYAYRGYLYAVGGNQAGTITNTTIYASLGSDGIVGSWATASTTFTTGRQGLSVTMYGGYLYMLGGYDNTPTYYRDVQYAQIQSDGNLGSWSYTTNLSTAVGSQFGSVAVSNGFLYYLGGYTGSATSNAVAYAPINSDGTLGSWQTTTAFMSARDAQFSLMYGGNLYVGCGYAGETNYRNDVQVAPVNAIARTGTYSLTIDLQNQAAINSVTYNTIANPAAVNVAYSARAVDGSLISSGNLAQMRPPDPGTSACTTSNITGVRYMVFTVQLDDSMGQGTGGAFADANGINANVTDITVNYTPYHPSPDIRLRLGKTLQEGALGPLDTCTDA